MILMDMKQTRDQHKVVHIVRFDHIAIPTSTPTKNILGCKIFSGFIITQKKPTVIKCITSCFSILVPLLADDWERRCANLLASPTCPQQHQNGTALILLPPVQADLFVNARGGRKLHAHQLGLMRSVAGSTSGEGILNGMSVRNKHSPVNHTKEGVSLVEAGIRMSM